MLIVIAFAIRPYVQTVHGSATPLARRVMAGYQRADHLPVDPTRLYYELSLDWVFWYIGVPAVVLGTLGAALLARRCLRGEAPGWLLPMLSFGWIIVATLARPGITPDQPWASRRLVPGVLPGFLLLAAWAAAWLQAGLRQRGAPSLAGRATAALCAAVLVVPAAVTTFGLSLSGAGGLGTKTTYAGRDCRRRPPLRRHPGRRVGRHRQLRDRQPARADRPGHVRRAHRPDVPAAAGLRSRPSWPAFGAPPAAGPAGWPPDQLTPFGGPVRQVMALRSTADAHLLTRPPDGTTATALNVWMWAPPA